MKIKKNIAMPKPNKQKYLLSNFLGIDTNLKTNSLPCDYADEVFNFNLVNKKLENCLGVEEFELVDIANNKKFSLPSFPLNRSYNKIFSVSNDDKLCDFSSLIVSNDYGIEVLKLKAGEKWKFFDTTSNFHSAISYLHKDKNLVIFASEEDGIVIFDGEKLEKIENTKSINYLCIHSERVFAVVEGKRNSLYFSASFDPYNWNISLENGGYIDFDGTLGDIINIVSLGEYLYVFCDYGIYRISAYADQTQFYIKKIVSNFDRIFAKSIVLCGDRIMFATARKIYTFDGNNCKALSFDLQKLDIQFKNNIEGIYCNHKYFLSLDYISQNMDYDALKGGEYNNFMVVYDIELGSVGIISGIDIYSITSISSHKENNVLCLSKNCNKVVCLRSSENKGGQAYQSKWYVSNINFGKPTQYKVIRGLEYNTTIPYVFGVVANGQIYEYCLDCRENYLPINIKATKFDFFIKCQENKFEIESPFVVVDFLRR